MDTTDTNITFNDEGICDHCLTFDEHIKPVNFIKRTNRNYKKHQRFIKGKDFDCIFMSGGIDSSIYSIL